MWGEKCQQVLKLVTAGRDVRGYKYLTLKGLSSETQVSMSRLLECDTLFPLSCGCAPDNSNHCWFPELRSLPPPSAAAVYESGSEKGAAGLRSKETSPGPSPELPRRNLKPLTKREAKWDWAAEEAVEMLCLEMGS